MSNKLGGFAAEGSGPLTWGSAGFRIPFGLEPGSDPASQSPGPTHRLWSGVGLAGVGTDDGWVWRAGSLPAGPAVVVDIDGVVSDATHRQHWVSGRDKDWSSFFEACGSDPVIEETARLVSLLDPELVVVLLTGRPVSVREATVEWLGKMQLRWDLLMMRDVGDYAASRSFKARSVGELRAAGFDLRLAFDDDLRNCEMFRSEGVPCVYLHSGYYG